VIDIICPTLGRAGVLGPLAANVAEVTKEDFYRLLFVVDHGDTATQDELRRLGADFVLCDGTYPAKSNAGYRRSDSEILAVIGDDVTFHAGWLDAALVEFEDSRVCLVGSDDLSPSTSTRAHATMPILRRTYCEDPGASWALADAIYFEGYHHQYSETEICGLAQHRGVWGWAEGCVIEHCHPDWGKREPDSTDEKGQRQNVDQDRRLFIHRQKQWSR
jgi:hypothetical protein